MTLAGLGYRKSLRASFPISVNQAGAQAEHNQGNKWSALAADWKPSSQEGKGELTSIVSVEGLGEMLLDMTMNPERWSKRASS